MVLEGGDQYEKGVLRVGSMRGGGVARIKRKEVIRTLAGMKRGRAVPGGSLPKEVWEVAMEKYGEVAEGVMGTMRRVTEGGELPRRWQCSQTAQINKYNGKKRLQRDQTDQHIVSYGKVPFQNSMEAHAGGRGELGVRLCKREVQRYGNCRTASQEVEATYGRVFHGHDHEGCCQRVSLA